MGRGLGCSPAGLPLAPRAGAARGFPAPLPTCAQAAGALLCRAPRRTHRERYSAAGGPGKGGPRSRMGNRQERWGAGRGRVVARPDALQVAELAARCGTRVLRPAVPKRGRMGRRADSLGSPHPLTLLSSCFHRFLPSTPLSRSASLTFPLPPSSLSRLLPAFNRCVDKDGGGKMSRLLNLSDTLEIICSRNLEMTRTTFSKA